MSDQPSTPVRLAIVGCGSRGHGYANWALAHPERARVVAIAEPDPARREQMAEHRIAPELVFDDWHELLAAGRVADAVIVATQDALHVEPAIAFLDAGWDVLLEKPMAPTADECRRIADAARRGDGLFAVCHVLQYTPYTRMLRQLLADGAIGEIVSIQHLEPVGWWHMAHSFVRGNWRNEAASSPMLLAKSCHDIAWLEHVVGEPISHSASFGSLKHFRPENRPEGAADRCLDCPLQDDCAYSAKRIYLERAQAGEAGWPMDTVVPTVTVESIGQALREGPYGRCVYACDNDVVDHQVVAMEFANGATGVFTMTAFDGMRHRQTRIFGTQGRLEGDGETIEVLDFRTDMTTGHDPRSIGDASAEGGHGGGDEGLMDAFVHAVATRDMSGISSGVDETLSSHLAVFDAETARREGRVITAQG